jgi:hypothetical protein
MTLLCDKIGMHLILITNHHILDWSYVLFCLTRNINARKPSGLLIKIILRIIARKHAHTHKHNL